MVPLSVTLSDLNLDFKVTVYALKVLCAQLMRDLFAIAKFLFIMSHMVMSDFSEMC